MINLTKRIKNIIKEINTNDEGQLKKLKSILLFSEFLLKEGRLNKKDFDDIKSQIKSKKNTNSSKFLPKKLIEKIFPKKKTNTVRKASSLPENYMLGMYLSLLLIISILAFLGLITYKRLSQQTGKILGYSTQPIRKGRTISFQGKLTDSLGNPITTQTDIVFKLYDSNTGGNLLYTGSCTGVNGIIPDQDGIINVIIGQDCGMSKIPANVFTENANIYLGITVGTDPEMTPRQQIANVGYAMNTDTLQGLPPDDGSTTLPFIPYINSAGDMMFAVSAPAIRSTYQSANFEISSANIVTLTSAGTGDIILQATESGDIKFRTQGTTDTQTRVIIDNTGKVGINTLIPYYQLDVNGTLKTSSTLYADGGINTTARELSLDSFSGTTIINDDLIIKGKTALSNVLQLPDGTAASPALTFINDPDTGVYRVGADSLGIITGGSVTQGITISSAGNVGIGTTNPVEKLEITGNILLPKTGTATSTTQYPSYLLKLTGSAWDTAESTVVDKTFSLKTIGLSGSGGDSRLGVINNAGSEVFTITESGNVGIGTTSPAQKFSIAGSLGILEGGTSPVYYTIFQGGDQSTNITYTLPTSITTGGYLQTDASGNLSWTTTITANSLKWNSLTNPDGNIVLNMGNNITAFTWGTMTGTSNLFTFTDSVNNTGTGYLVNISTASGSTLNPIMINAAGTSAFVVNNSGNIGIGTSTPDSSYKLDVAGVGNFTGLSVNGIAGLTDADGFCGTGDLTDITTAGGLVTGVECDQGWVADLAEEYNTLDKIPPGYIVSISRDKNATPNTVEKATYKSFPIGIVSTYPYRIMGKNKELNKNPVVVGLTGRIPTYVSLENGAIKKGDPLTISRDNPGVAVKALEGDLIVAYALEDYDGSFSDSEWVKRIKEELRIRALKKEAYKKLLNTLEPTPAGLGKIMAFISPNQYMANNLQEFTLDERGYLKNIKITPDNQIKNKKSGKVYENFSLFAQSIIGKIKSGIIISREIITDKLDITTENITIAGQTLRDYIYQVVDEYVAQKNIIIDESQISSPVILTDQIASENDRIEITDASGEATLSVETNQQKTTIKGDLTIKQNTKKNQLSKLILENYKGDQTVIIDNQGNASFSGTLQAKEIQTENLKVKNIEAENIKTQIAEIEQRLTKIVEKQPPPPTYQQNSDENTPLYERLNQIQSLLSEIPNTPLPDPSFYQKIQPDLKVDFASLKQLYVDQIIAASNLLISQSLTVDKLFFQKNQIITLTSDLNIIAKERVVFFDNLVAIDNKGNLTTEGKIIAKGGIKTNTIESTDGKNIAIKLQNKTEKLEIVDASSENEEIVASIDASGSAYFKELALEKYNPSTPEADLILADAAPSSLSAILNTDSSVAGVGVIPENTQIIEIRNNKITSDTLVYLTPATPDIKGQLTLAEQGKGFFKVLITEPNDKKIKFNWLIIK